MNGLIFSAVLCALHFELQRAAVLVVFRNLWLEDCQPGDACREV
jgi:hypothetical protein